MVKHIMYNRIYIVSGCNIHMLDSDSKNSCDILYSKCSDLSYFSLPQNFDGFPPLPQTPETSENSREPTPIRSLAASLERIQIRTPSLEEIQSRMSSLEHIQSRASSLEHIQAPYSPSPIPICCRTPTKNVGKPQPKRQRPKKVSFRLDELPPRRPQTT